MLSLLLFSLFDNDRAASLLFCYVTEFRCYENVKSAEIFGQLCQQYGENILSKSQVFP